MSAPASHPKRRGQNEKGAILVLVAVMTPVLIGVTGLAVDVGMLYHDRRRMQTAADAGALAGTHEVWRSRVSSVTSTARREAGTNGFSHGAAGVDVTVHHPPQTGFHVGDPRFVEVVVQQPSPTYFMRLFGFNQANVVARAVAGAGANGQNCIYALDPSMPRAFEANSSARLDASCGVIVDSTATNAMHLTSSVNIAASSVNVTGNYVTESNARVSPQPAISVPPEPDPLAHLAAPTYGACNFTNFTRSSGNIIMNPGVYCGGITLQSSARATLNPGMYILRGGGLRMESSTQIEGDGVTFYNTAGGGYAYRGFEFQSSTQARLRAPTTGDYAGILFFQDRNAGSPSDVNWFQSSSNSYFEGAMYFPTQILRLESSTTTDARYTIIVARNIVMESSAFFRVRADYSSLAGGSPIKKLSLVE